MSDKKPNRGQTIQLERIGTDAWILVGEQERPGAPVIYRLMERGTGRQIHIVTDRMVQSLLNEGWIEVVGGGSSPPRGAWRWGYSITKEGIRARDRGWE